MKISRFSMMTDVLGPTYGSFHQTNFKMTFRSHESASLDDIWLWPSHRQAMSKTCQGYSQQMKVIGHASMGPSRTIFAPLCLHHAPFDAICFPVVISLHLGFCYEPLSLITLTWLKTQMVLGNFSILLSLFHNGVLQLVSYGLLPFGDR